MVVRSCKTEHHEGGSQRVVLIFPELRPYLEAAFELASPGVDQVISRYRSPAYLRKQLGQIINLAGEKRWPKLFHNLRASCETDLARIHPLKAVCDWIGNSVTVAQRHYLQATEADFERASGGNLHQSVPATDCLALPTIQKIKKNTVSPALQGDTKWAMRDSNWMPQPATRTTGYVKL